MAATRLFSPVRRRVPDVAFCRSPGLALEDRWPVTPDGPLVRQPLHKPPQIKPARQAGLVDARSAPLRPRTRAGAAVPPLNLKLRGGAPRSGRDCAPVGPPLARRCARRQPRVRCALGVPLGCFGAAPQKRGPSERARPPARPSPPAAPARLLLDRPQLQQLGLGSKSKSVGARARPGRPPISRNDLLRAHVERNRFKS